MLNGKPRTANLLIPEVAREVVEALAQRIRPVVLHRGQPHYIQDVDLFTVAFTWAPKPRMCARGLQLLGDVETLHCYSYYGFFKPSIAECLAQMPEAFAERAVAFEIIKSPETTDDLNFEIAALDAGFHVALTRFYTLEEQPTGS